MEVHSVPIVGFAIDFSGSFRSFEVHWKFLEPRIVHKVPKRFFTENTVSDVSVAINTAAEFSNAIVQMESFQMLDSNDLIELLHRRFVILFFTQRIPRRENVTRI